MSNTAPSRADPVVVFPLGWWCPPQETSQPHLPQVANGVTLLYVILWHHADSCSTLHEICIHFMLCCVLLRLGGCPCYPYLSGLLHWPWGNHMIAPWQSYDCPMASEVNMNMGKCVMNALNTHNKTTPKWNKTMSILIFMGYTWAVD